MTNQANDSLLLLVAHGSRDPEWSQAFEAMTHDTRRVNKMVKLAFMELSSPSIEDIVQQSISAYHLKEINVLPLFLATGKHLKKDIPEILDKLARQYKITINLLPPLGEYPLFHQTLAKIAETSCNKI
jgi:sirohydrochlorin cobaltochelatase